MDIQVAATPGGPIDVAESFESLSVNELIEKCWKQHFEPFYSKEGEWTTEAANLLTVLKTVSELYGMSPAKSFGPRKLKDIRRYMIDVQDLARTEINKRIGRIKRVFKFAVSEEMIPPSVYQGLQTVSGLRRGEHGVRESKRVKPVPDLWVCLTLPFVSRYASNLRDPVARESSLARRTRGRPGDG